jgi:RimJ/RimL family protein N-acetyltransferase
VRLDDLDAYVRMRCDPAMMAELGGPRPREGMEDKVRRDVASAHADAEWIKMIVLEDPEQNAEQVAGTLALWSHKDDHEDGGDGSPISEIGWMVLTEFQGRGLAKGAVRELLRLAREDGRWGPVHAFPGISNGPSNGICRSLGFTHVGEREITYADRRLHVNHWIFDDHRIADWHWVLG